MSVGVLLAMLLGFALADAFLPMPKPAKPKREDEHRLDPDIEEARKRRHAKRSKLLRDGVS